MNKRIPKVENIFRRVCEKYSIEQGKFTAADFYRICQEEKIFLMNHPDVKKMLFKYKNAYGAYVTCGNHKSIYLRSFFLKRINLFTAFHELGHHFCQHTGGLLIDTPKKESIKESEADYFAYLATNLKRGRNEEPQI